MQTMRPPIRSERATSPLSRSLSNFLASSESSTLPLFPNISSHLRIGIELLLCSFNDKECHCPGSPPLQRSSRPSQGFDGWFQDTSNSSPAFRPLIGPKAHQPGVLRVDFSMRDVGISTLSKHGRFGLAADARWLGIFRLGSMGNPSSAGLVTTRHPVVHQSLTTRSFFSSDPRRHGHSPHSTPSHGDAGFPLGMKWPSDSYPKVRPSGLRHRASRCGCSLGHLVALHSLQRTFGSWRRIVDRCMAAWHAIK